MWWNRKDGGRGEACGTVTDGATAEFAVVGAGTSVQRQSSVQVDPHVSCVLNFLPCVLVPVHLQASISTHHLIQTS